MNRKLATKSDLANIITVGGGTYSNNSNEILTSSFANSLDSDSIGGILSLTYNVESTGRSSYLSNECVLYEDIHFVKNSTPGPVIDAGYTFVIAQPDLKYNKETGEFISFGTTIGNYTEISVPMKTIEGYNYISITSLYNNDSTTVYPNYTVVNQNQIPSWLKLEFKNNTNLPYNEFIAYKANEDSSDEDRSFTLVLRQNESNKECNIVFNQFNKNIIYMQDFEDMIITYTWEEQDGSDLDTSTKIGYKLKDGINIEYTLPVGFRQIGNDKYDTILYSGDNITSGDESCAIRFKRYFNSLGININDIEYISVIARANWYQTKGSRHQCVMLFAIYGEGDITKEGFKFISSGNKINDCQMTQLVPATGLYNYCNAEKWYTKTMEIKYYPSNNTAEIYFYKNEQQAANDGLSGWHATDIYTKYTNVTKNISSEEHNYRQLDNFNIYKGNHDIGDEVICNVTLSSNNPIREYKYLPDITDVGYTYSANMQNNKFVYTYYIDKIADDGASSKLISINETTPLYSQITLLKNQKPVVISQVRLNGNHDYPEFDNLRLNSDYGAACDSSYDNSVPYDKWVRACSPHVQTLIGYFDSNDSENVWSPVEITENSENLNIVISESITGTECETTVDLPEVNYDNAYYHTVKYKNENGNTGITHICRRGKNCIGVLDDNYYKYRRYDLESNHENAFEKDLFDYEEHDTYITVCAVVNNIKSGDLTITKEDASDSWYTFSYDPEQYKLNIHCIANDTNENRYSYLKIYCGTIVDYIKIGQKKKGN